MQFPEGLKAGALKVAEKLEAEGHTVFISASPCYGACDLALEQAKAVGAKRVIHYGHAPFPSEKQPGIEVEYAEAAAKVDFRPVLLKALADPDFAGCKKVGLVTTVQHVGQLGEIRRFLEAKGKRVLVGRHGPLAEYDGQVLGCDAGAAKSVDAKAGCILFFGGGRFHPIAVAIACRNRVMAADPFLGKAFWMDGEKAKYEKRRKGMLMLGLRARRFGILVSTKPGQFRLAAAEELKKRLEALGREAAILVSDRIEPDALLNFRSFDFYIDAACPRIAVDDFAQFGKPVLGLADAGELLLLLGQAGPTRT